MPDNARLSDELEGAIKDLEAVVLQNVSPYHDSLNPLADVEAAEANLRTAIQEALAEKDQEIAALLKALAKAQASQSPVITEEMIERQAIRQYSRLACLVCGDRATLIYEGESYYCQSCFDNGGRSIAQMKSRGVRRARQITEEMVELGANELRRLDDCRLGGSRNDESYGVYFFERSGEEIAAFDGYPSVEEAGQAVASIRSRAALEAAHGVTPQGATE